MNGSAGAAFQAPHRRSQLRSRGLQLEFAEWGRPVAGHPVVVAFHGYLDAADFFAPLAVALREMLPDLAIVAHSAAGHGASDWADSYAWSDHTVDGVAVVQSVLDRVGAASPVFLVGHSFGGIQASDVARHRVSRLAGVVNLDAVASPVASNRTAFLRELARSRTEHPASRRLQSRQNFDALVARRQDANPRVPGVLLRELVERLAHRLEDGTWTWRVDPLHAGWVRSWEMCGVRKFAPLDALAAVGLPSLIVTGAAMDHPAVRGPYPGDAALARVPRSRHRRLHDAGHYVHLERPQAVAEAIAEFIHDNVGCVHA